jgi:hypothetical protein
VALVYTNMPFTVEGRVYDPDSFPNPVTEYVWTVISQPNSANLVFLSSNSLTPTVIVDTPGSYEIELSAFDGDATSTATYNFTANPAYAANVSSFGSCASTGSGLSTVVQVVETSATSVLSQQDANNLAAEYAANALSAILECSNASMQLVLPPDAPSGASYSIYVAPTDMLPREDFGLDVFSSGNTPMISVQVGSGGVVAGSTIECASSLDPGILSSNQSISLIVQSAELPPAESALAETTDYLLTVAPLALAGNVTGVVATKRQRNATDFAPLRDRALAYKVSVPEPQTARFSMALTNRVPPLPNWQVNAAGYEDTAAWNGQTVNALGCFLLTSGTLMSPLGETLIMGINSGNSILSDLESWYDFYGFSQIPYQGSLYNPLYTDRRAVAAVPHTGSVSVSNSAITTWAQALWSYVSNNNISAPYNVYFRAGNWNGSTYTWYASSMPLYLERSSGVTLGSLTANGSILAAANSVLVIANASAVTSTCFATVRGVPALYLDMFRFNTLVPNGASLGVYSSSGTRLTTITPNPVAGRGYDITNLATIPAINTLLQTATATPFSLIFYLLNSSGNPIANSFPLMTINLTGYTSAFSVTNTTAVGSLPAGTSNQLIISNSGVKIYLSSASG